MLEPDERKLLYQIAEEVAETKRLVRSLVRAQNLSTLITVLKWVVIIGLSYGVYYYLSPVLTQLLDTYQQIGGSVSNAKNLLPF